MADEGGGQTTVEKRDMVMRNGIVVRMEIKDQGCLRTAAAAFLL